MKTTTLSLEPPSLTYNHPATSDPPAASSQHALVLVFGKADITEDLRAYSLFLHRLRSIVQHDGRDSPQIDMVQMIGRQPDRRTCKVLKGLRPRHFEAESGLLNEDDLEQFEQLNWPLESFMLIGVDSMSLPSKFIQCIPSITLHNCFEIFFSPATDRSLLHHLTITEGDAFDVFMHLMEMLCVADQLETLKLHSGNYEWWNFNQIDFMNTLRRCTSLHSLDLNLFFFEGRWNDDSEFFTLFEDLPRYFLDTIEYLRFRGPPDIGKYLPVWLQCAAEPSWLPNIKTLSFKIEIKASGTPDINAHVEQFLGALLQGHPAVQIIPHGQTTQSRSAVQ